MLVEFVIFARPETIVEDFCRFLQNDRVVLCRLQINQSINPWHSANLFILHHHPGHVDDGLDTAQPQTARIRRHALHSPTIVRLLARCTVVRDHTRLGAVEMKLTLRHYGEDCRPTVRDEVRGLGWLR